MTSTSQTTYQDLSTTNTTGVSALLDASSPAHKADLQRRLNDAIRNSVPAIGQYWKGQGGIYAGMSRNPETGEIRHTIMHPEAITPTVWGTYGKNIEGAASYWDGAANTTAMRNSGHCTEIITALDALPHLDGHSDYVIPAQRQLNLLTCNISDLLEKTGHWSSTQYSARHAWYQGFENGHQLIRYKDDMLAARAVRSILVIE